MIAPASEFVTQSRTASKWKGLPQNADETEDYEAKPPTPNPYERSARASKSERIASVVIRSAAGDIEQMRVCADLIASTSENGTRFARSLWAELGEDWHAGDWQTRAAVAERIMEHRALVCGVRKMEVG